MKKLLLVTEYFWPEEFIVNDLADEAEGYGYKVTVLTLQPSYPRGRMAKGFKNSLFTKERRGTVEIIRLKTILGYKESIFYKLLNYAWFAFYGSIAIFFIKAHFSNVFIYQVGPLTTAIPGILYGKLRRIPVAIWTQDVWPDSVYAYGFKQTKILSKTLDYFVCWIYSCINNIFISCNGFEQVLRHYTEKPMVYAPNWPLSSFVSSDMMHSSKEPPVFIFAGNVGKVQNLDNVIRGYALACNNMDFSGILRIVGDGSALEDLKKLALDLNVSVDFVGRKPSSSMSAEYSRASFLVLSLADRPVFRLTVPSKFQMYLSVGKPILCVAKGEVRDLVLNLQLGINASDDSPKAIADAFSQLVNASQEDINTWSRNAKCALVEVFDKKQIINNIFKILEDPKWRVRNN